MNELNEYICVRNSTVLLLLNVYMLLSNKWLKSLHRCSTSTLRPRRINNPLEYGLATACVWQARPAPGSFADGERERVVR